MSEICRGDSNWKTVSWKYVLLKIRTVELGRRAFDPLKAKKLTTSVMSEPIKCRLAIRTSALIGALSRPGEVLVTPNKSS